MFSLWLQVMQLVRRGSPYQPNVDYSHLLKSSSLQAWKLLFLSSMSFKNKWPTGGTNVFFKIEGDLQAMPDVRRPASPLPFLRRAWMEFLYGGLDEGALLLSALSTLLLLTYEDAMGAGKWFITGCAPLAPSHISNVVRWGEVLSSVCTWTLWTR